MDAEQRPALGGQTARLGGIAITQVAGDRARQEGVQRLAHPRRRRILVRRDLCSKVMQ